MYNRIILLVIFVCGLTLRCSAQTSSNNLYGVWCSKGYRSVFYNIFGNAFVFITDSTGYLTTPKGLVHHSFLYSTDINKQPIWFDYTLTGKDKFNALIKVVNDTTLLINIGSTDKRPDNKMKGKRVLIYHKIKNISPQKFIHPFNNTCLLGEWIVNSTNNKNIIKSLTFEDSTSVVYTEKDEYPVTYTYKTNLSVMPKLIDMKNAVSGQVSQGFIEMLDDTTLHIQLYKAGKRPSNWKMFGNDVIYTRKKHAKNLLM